METKVKNEKEITAMKEGGRRLHAVLQKLLALVRPGVTPKEIDAAAFETIKRLDTAPSFLTVRDYQWATCVCVNEVVVHGIPTDIPLRDGDVVTLDVGLMYEGLHTDTAWTSIVGSEKFEVRSEIKKFLDVGEKALWAGIAQARGGNHIGHISQAIQKIVEGNGYHIVQSLVGHGIGYQLHEYPHVPNMLMQPIAQTPQLFPGQTFAIEVIYTRGSPEIMTMPDGWTVATVDRSIAAVFEHTVLITETSPIVLTR